MRRAVVSALVFLSGGLAAWSGVTPWQWALTALPLIAAAQIMVLPSPLWLRWARGGINWYLDTGDYGRDRWLTYRQYKAKHSGTPSLLAYCPEMSKAAGRVEGIMFYDWNDGEGSTMDERLRSVMEALVAMGAPEGELDEWEQLIDELRALVDAANDDPT